MDTNSLARVIYPQPKQVTWQEGILIVDRQVILNLPVNSKCTDFFVETWENFTCCKTSIVVNTTAEQAENSFSLEVAGVPQSAVLAEKSTYALTVGVQGVFATAIDEISLRQAWFSMLQMLDPKPGTRKIEGFQIPCVDIQDYPLLKFRSAHLCVFPETTLSALEKSINLLGMHKYTHVVIEFWGMLKMDALPELSWPEAYSKDEVKPLLQRVRDLGMEPVPMFNHWGHATGSRVRNGRHVVLDQNPLLAPLFEPDGWTWCLTNPESLKILAGVRKELIEFFGDIDYFHLGCDEAYSHATCDSCRKHDPAVLLAEYLNSVNADLKSHGIRPFIWGDALLEDTKWEGYIALSRPDQRTHEAMDLLSRDFIIADWQYYLKNKNQTATFKHFMEKGFDVVTAPWHDFENINVLGELAIEQNAFGMMLTTWHTLPVKMGIIPRAGSVMWGGKDAGKDNPLYMGAYQMTSQAAFLRKIRKGPTDYENAGWRSFEVFEGLES
jgi:Glycosyl hydrolase family 20, catalytic domain